MTRLEIIQSSDPPDNMTTEDKLAYALASIMTWPNPDGTIMETYIPGWLADIGRSAIVEYVKQEENTP